jgi:putative redox protein
MQRIAHVILESTAGYVASAKIGRHQLTTDESTTVGGTDAGPAPFPLLLASLAACTSATLRMYAERKGWTLGTIHIDLEMFREADQPPSKIARVIKVSAPLDETQLQRLAEIAEKTPVTKTLKAGVAIETSVKPA